jgi:hypothetical protein
MSDITEGLLGATAAGKRGIVHEIKAVCLSLISLQVVVVVLFGLFTQYVPGSPLGAGAVYELYKDVAVMIFIGFGYLMTFLKKYGYGAVGFTFLLSAIVIEFGMLNVRPPRSPPAWSLSKP